MKEIDFALTIEKIGGQAYAVGGCVRDFIMERDCHDKDYVVVGVGEAAFNESFPGTRRVGVSFPVYLAEIDGRKREVAFARRERKMGVGYKGFSVEYGPEVRLEEDLFRRDLTINSMARSLRGGKIIDPYGGRDDIRAKIIRATSPHFSEDPVRALRAARLAAQLGFSIEPRTVELMRGCGEELRLETRERIFIELEKALSALCPSVFFRELNRAGLLQIVFPRIFDLIGKTQPLSYHPEGDAFEHSMAAVDKAALKTVRPEVRFAALAHDIGKGATPEEMLPHHYHHEKIGLAVLSEMNRGLCLPRLWKQCAEIMIKEHMRAPRLTRLGKIRDLLTVVAKHPIGFDGFNIVIEADCGFLPPYLAGHERYLAVIKSARDIPIPENLQGGAIGAWRRQAEVKALAEAMAAGFLAGGAAPA